MREIVLTHEKMQAALKQAAENAKSRAVWQDCPLRKDNLYKRLRGVREARQ